MDLFPDGHATPAKTDKTLDLFPDRHTYPARNYRTLDLFPDTRASPARNDRTLDLFSDRRASPTRDDDILLKGHFLTKQANGNFCELLPPYQLYSSGNGFYVGIIDQNLWLRAIYDPYGARVKVNAANLSDVKPMYPQESRQYLVDRPLQSMVTFNHLQGPKTGL